MEKVQSDEQKESGIKLLFTPTKTRGNFIEGKITVRVEGPPEKQQAR